MEDGNVYYTKIMANDIKSCYQLCCQIELNEKASLSALENKKQLCSSILQKPLPFNV